ncbi:MAG: hypothetical protein ACKOEY_04645 [Phenylobacterium sp.]
MTFSPFGRGHRVLDAIRHGPWRHTDLVDLIAKSDDPRDQRAAHFLILALKDHGLTTQRMGKTQITEAGFDALADLNAGFHVQPDRRSRITFNRRDGEAVKNPSPVAL